VARVSLNDVAGFGRMRFAFATSSVIFLFCAALSGQATPATQVRTFHVRGTVRDFTGAPIRDVRAQVTFRNAKLSQIVSTSEAGTYETDLPLGIYTMHVEALQFRSYRRPEFRMMKPINITINVVLARVPPTRGVFNREYGALPPRREGASNITYHDGDFFSIPSSDGAPLRLYISYVKRIRTDYSYDYAGDDDPPYEDPVFVAYDLFSLRANTVLYDMESRRLDARGNVVVEDGSGRRNAAAVMSFKIENGRATALP
jgi:hypothetical protein